MWHESRKAAKGVWSGQGNTEKKQEEGQQSATMFKNAVAEPSKVQHKFNTTRNSDIHKIVMEDEKCNQRLPHYAMALGAQNELAFQQFSPLISSTDTKEIRSFKKSKDSLSKQELSQIQCVAVYAKVRLSKDFRQNRPNIPCHLCLKCLPVPCSRTSMTGGDIHLMLDVQG